MVLAQHQGLLCILHHPSSEKAGAAQEPEKECIWDSQSQLTKQIFQTIWHHAEHVKQGEKNKLGELLETWHLSSQANVMHDRVLLS